jgi:hypothetical protein
MGELEEGVRLVREAIAAQPGWLELLGRLTPESAPAVEQVRARLAEA